MGKPLSKASDGGQIDIVNGMQGVSKVNPSRGLGGKC